MIVLQIIHTDENKVTCIIVNEQYKSLTLNIHNKHLQMPNDDAVEELFTLLGRSQFKVSDELGTVINLNNPLSFFDAGVFCWFFYN